MKKVLLVCNYLADAQQSMLRFGDLLHRVLSRDGIDVEIIRPAARALSLFGGRAHRIIGRIAFVSVAVLALLGFWLHGSPSGFLYAVLLGIMMKVPHPPPAIMEPLGTKRILIAIVTLIVFMLCFLPFPITMT